MTRWGRATSSSSSTDAAPDGARPPSPATAPGDEPGPGTGGTQGSPRDGAAPLAVLAVAFVLSRVGYRWGGVAYDATLLPHAWQVLDPSLLEDHLLESVWYLHMQPPLFNLFVGTLLLASPFDDAVTLEGAWLVLGALLTWLVYDVARSLRFSRWAAVAIAVVIACGPGVVLYEAWFEYELPVAVLLTSTMAAFARLLRHGRPRALAATCALAAAAVLTRSLLHPAWFAAVVVIAVLAAPATRRAHPWKVAAAAGIPVLVVAGVIVRNQVLFDRTDLSSWVGWNLHRIAFGDIPLEEKQAMVDEGTLSPAALLLINQPLEVYEPLLGPCASSRPWVEALSLPRKEPDRVYFPDQPPDNNLNHECYLRVYDAFLEDSLAAIRARPREYVRAVASAAQIWALPTTDYAFLRLNRDAIEPVETWYRHLVYVDVPMEPPWPTDGIRAHMTCVDLPTGPACYVPGGQYRMAMTIVVGTAGAVLLALWGMWRWIRRGDEQAAYWVMNGLVIGWVTVASIALELQENHRFRFVVEPLTLVTVIWLLRGAWRWLVPRLTGSARRRSRRPGRATPVGSGAAPH